MILKTALLGIIFAIGFAWIVEFLEFADFFKVVHNQVPGPCHSVENVFATKDNGQGAEDIDVLPNGLAIFSSGLNYMRNPVLVGIPGRIMTFNFNRSDEPAKELTWKLNPHGISLWIKNEMTFVYVIQHGMEEDNQDESVEKFRWEISSGKLIHLETFKDQLFTSLNDLVLVNEDQFYVTNDYNFRNNWLRRLEYFSFLPINNVIFFNGHRGHVVANYLRRANGINVSPDHRFLYVAESGAKLITSYKILPSMQLEQVSSTYLGTLVDNIFVDADSGDLWLGTHPIGYKIFWKVAFPVGATAPSQVLRLRMENGELLESDQIYADNGKNLVASGTAAFYKGSILIGTPTHKLLYCECFIC